MPRPFVKINKFRKRLTFNLFYYFKNLILLTPFKYGYYHHLRQFQDKKYDYESEKPPVMNKHNSRSGWNNKAAGSIVYRDYCSYDEYLAHQTYKFTVMLKLKGGFSNADILHYRNTFYNRFRHIDRLLPKSALILCLGARQGTEVEVLRDLGFRNAVGIDLNPGEDNPLVLKGDFMSLDCADQTLDMIYTNCLDHAFNLERFFQENARVLKTNGYAIYDIAMQSQPAGFAFESVMWNSEEAVFLLALKYFQKVIRLETESAWKWVLLQK